MKNIRRLSGMREGNGSFMKIGRISIISIDLDGTLLDAKQKISKKNADALRRCRERGIYVFLSSGRSFEAVRAFAAGMSVDCGIISCNGARMDASAYGPTLLNNCIPEETAFHVLDKLLQLNIYFECYTPGRVYMSSGFAERFHDHQARVLDLDGYRLEYVESTERMRREALGCAYKFVVFDPEKKRLDDVRRAFRDFDISLTSSWGDNVELMKNGAGKGRALTWFAEQKGIPKEEIMSFGDHMNDLDMLKASGWPVAMENAVDELKRYAKVIAPRHDQSGVGRIICKYVLNTGE